MKIIIIENPRPLTFDHYNDVANAPLSASLNSGYALAVARRADWNTVFIDLSISTENAEDIASRILAEDGDIILFHWVYSWGNEQFVCDIMANIRLESSAPLGAFGLFPTLSRLLLLKNVQELDFILSGEFEEALSDLLTCFRKDHSLAALPGVSLRGGEYMPRPVITDLAKLPVPDDVGANCSYTSMNIAASRGCYGECSFCFIRSYYGCSRRVRDINSLEHELTIRLTRRHIQSLYFVDPSFIAQGQRERDRAVEISRLALGQGLPFGFETRVDTIDTDLLKVLAENGAASVFLGIESGCDSVLKRISKQIDTNQIRRGVRAVLESGIKLNLGFIMFEPDTVLSELEENFKFLDELGLLTDHELTANLLYHNQIVLYGSAAWERFEREKRLLVDNRLPFEARYSFQDDRVGQVCLAMSRLTSAYFNKISEIRRESNQVLDDCCESSHSSNPSRFNREDVNYLLKDAFRAFCSASDINRPQSLAALEDLYNVQLQGIFS